MSGKASTPKKVKKVSAIAKGYLVLYNAVSAAGWAYCLYLTVQGFMDNQSPAILWETLCLPLTITQTMAIMEVVHSLVKLVSSPWQTVALQVASRILLVWGYTRPFVECQRDWSLFLMVTAWSLAEIPRYIFYIFAQFMPSEAIPLPLFWLRYSLFIVLYPAGISGEMLQTYAFWRDARAANPEMEYATYVVWFMYVFGSPYMVLNMWKNRGKSFKKRAEFEAEKAK